MIADLVSFRILGVPAPQGSKTRMPNGALLEAASATGRAKHEAWRSAVAWQSRQAIGSQLPLDGPIALRCVFRFPMPASRPARARRAGVWPHTVKPDLDKVLRATFDGMKDGGLIADDARIARIDVAAVEVIGWTGAQVTVGPWDVSGDCEQDCRVCCNLTCSGSFDPFMLEAR